MHVTLFDHHRGRVVYVLLSDTLKVIIGSAVTDFDFNIN